VPRAKQRTPALSDSVLRTTLDLVETEGVSLTARSVAAAANTSPAALYELFGDKAGLLRAVFFEGFGLLAEELASVATTSDPHRDLVATLATTRRFALDRPMLFELMFARPFAEFRPGPDDHAAAAAVYRTVMGRVDRCLHSGVLAGDRIDVAQVLIATNRGLIAAELAGILGATPVSRERRWALGVEAVLAGLRLDAPAPTVASGSSS
jgi:AcrR family transcriptional regulator